MNTKTLPLLLVLSALSSAATLSAEECVCSAPVAVITKTLSAAGEKTDAPKRHPLKGVVIDVLAAKSALLVKHEEIPGVMKAMTMLLKVDEAGLKAVKKGDAVTGLLVRKTDGWWLEDVKPAVAAETK